jgi:ubiquitin carboxyl-terminal hydrolase 8
MIDVYLFLLVLLTISKMTTEVHEQITIDDVIMKHNTSGLANAGATCYINTTIQCLGYCSEFLKFILAGPRPNSQTPLANELRDVYLELWVKRNAIVPHRFLRSLQSAVGQYINIFEQNDINEFLMLYIDKLNTDVSVELLVDDEDIAKLKENASKISNPLYRELVLDMDIAWLNTIKKEYSPIMDIFYGQLVSQIVCGNCNHIHHNYETYSNLSLSIKKTNDSTLQECMESFFTDEIINKTDKEWICDICNVSTQSKKSVRLWKNPNIMVISLKRFNHDLVKNNTKVTAPLNLDLGQFSIHTPRHKYNLVSIGHHQGGMGSGHYNCVCRHKNNNWYAIDDVMVREAQPSELDYVLNNGYMYFYELATT